MAVKCQWEKYEMLKINRRSCDGSLELNEMLYAKKDGVRVGGVWVNTFFLAVCDQKFNWAATAIEDYSCGVCGLSSKETVVAHGEEGPDVEKCEAHLSKEAPLALSVRILSAFCS